MSAAPAESAHQDPVERFKPTNGMFVGWAGLACAAVAVVYCAGWVHTLTGLRVALGAVFFAIVVWVTQLRPRATVYPHHLVLKNALRDTSIPLAAIDEVSVRQTLRVFADDQRHVCIGIGVPVREELRRKRKNRPNLLGASRWGEFIERAERAAPDQTAMPYQTFVVTRIEELVEQEKKQAGDRPPRAVRRHWAWPEITALAVTGTGFLATLLL
jgi:hypothetical protein